jgi:hypothetical protein
MNQCLKESTPLALPRHVHLWACDIAEICNNCENPGPPKGQSTAQCKKLGSKALGLEIPPKPLFTAGEVIE